MVNGTPTRVRNGNRGSGIGKEFPEPSLASDRKSGAEDPDNMKFSRKA